MKWPCQFKLSFPKSIFFILGNEFCERYSFYGMRSILMLYLTQDVLYPRDKSKMLYHGFAFLNYFMPLCGAILADVKFGKFKTIWTLSIVYTIGQCLLALSSVRQLHFPQLEVAIVALMTIAVGAGGIKPCVSAFGGDQFEPSQHTARDKFYSLFYFAINVGAVLSMTMSPIFRADVFCFGKDSCYPLAFGFPALLMVVATIIFVSGWKMYKMVLPKGNVIMDVSKCIGHALKRRSQSRVKRNHWLDYADDEYDAQTIADVKTAMSVLVMFLPIPVFWALFDQQGSAWTLQSAMMDGRTPLFEVKPDQMDSLNAMLVIVFIPIFTYLVYPLLAKCNVLTKPLQRMAAGMLLAAVAFCIAAFVYMKIEEGLPKYPDAGKTEVVLHNTLPCDMKVRFAGLKEFPLPKYESVILKDIEFVPPANGSVSVINGSVSIDVSTCKVVTSAQTDFSVKNAQEKMAYSVLFRVGNGDKVDFEQQATEDRERDMQVHKPKVRFVHVTSNPPEEAIMLLYKASSGYECTNISAQFNESTYTLVRSNTKFSFCFAKPVLKGDDCPHDCVSHENMTDHTFEKGGIFTAILIDDGSNIVWNVVTTGNPDSVSMLYQVPQYVVLTTAEVMLSITALSFAYAEAPETLKSVFQAAWLMTVAFGNVIVLIVDPVKAALGVEKESISFFVYSTLMIIDMVLFAFLATKYRYKSETHRKQEKEKKDEDTKF